MKLLFTGKANKGSWQIRAAQMAQGIGDAIPFATEKECRRADFIVVLKRAPVEVLNAVRNSGRPWAWDVIDYYRQPECATWSRDYAINVMREALKSFRPTVVCWANQKMREDIGNAADVVIPHHARPGLQLNPIRERIELIGYEGAAEFLGHWRGTLEAAAQSIGARFTEKLSAITDCDVVIAARGDRADNYATRNWKSNVKLANAHASGTPFIGQPDPGYLETASGAERWAQTPLELERALNELSSRQERQRVSDIFRASVITVEQCRKQWVAVAEAHA